MTYIIYKNIKENEFIEIKSRLDLIEKISSLLMKTHGFDLSERYYNDVLALDYVHEDNNFGGNIGITYDEEESGSEKKVFKFYVLKAYDTSTQRFYKREMLPKLYSLKEVEKEFVSLFETCISIYNAWGKEDLTEFIDLLPAGLA